MPRFDAAGVSLFALSYDEQDALAEVATAHEITYTLLSDPHSDIIRRFGILNCGSRGIVNTEIAAS